MFYRIIVNSIIGLLLFVFLQVAYADNMLISAAPERYSGHDVGVVYINGAVVMRFYAPGVYQSPYVRAQAVAEMLTDIGSKGTDLASIQVMNGTTEIVGIVGNRNVFRVFEDDVIYNNTTAESLAADWANNIKNAVNLAKVDNSSGTAASVLPAHSTQDVQSQPAAEVKQTTSVQKNEFAKPKEKPSRGSFLTHINWKVVSITFLFLAIAGIVFIFGKAIFKRRKIVVEDEIITKKVSTDELENTISHLIAELEDKSAKITAEFQEKIGYLETLMMSIDKKIEQMEMLKETAVSAKVIPEPVMPELDESELPAMPELEEIPVPVKVSRKASPPASREPVAKKEKAEPPIEKHHRTKQEIIYEMADQGKPVTDIAKKLGIGVGEVKLILDLKQ